MALRQGIYIDSVPRLAEKTSFAKEGIFVNIGGDSAPVAAAPYYILNRGRNTGAGDAYVYWTSPTHYDPTGVYYPAGKPPFCQLTDIIGVATVKNSA
jgi:hypothetical protein